MYSREKNPPYRFEPGKPKQGTEEIDLKTTRNVKWVAKLGSQSYGNVTVAGGKVFIGTNNDSSRDPQHEGDRSILMCFDEKTGEFLWQLVIPKLPSGKVNDWENLGLLSSPTVEGDRLYVVTSRCEVMCLDVNGQANGNDGPFQDEAQYVVGAGKPKAKIGPKDADIIWKYDMMDELGVFPHNASNCSVLIVDDLVYACTSNGQDGTIRRVVGEYAQFIHHVILPDNIRIFRTNLCLWFARSHDILRFILERSVIAVGLAVHVEAHHLTPAVHDVEPVAFNRR